MEEDVMMRSNKLGLRFKRLRFGDGPRRTATSACINRRLGATVRYEDEKEIEEGDVLIMKNRGGEFGCANVLYAEERRAFRVMSIIELFDAEYGSDNTTELLHLMNKFYKSTIMPTTFLKVIVYDPVVTDVLTYE